jgi:hypothetical protein
MVKCPFCQYENEEGALFCEQCKSDLGIGEPVGSTPLAQEGHAQAGGDAGAPPEGVPVAAVVEEAPPAHSVPEAAPVDLPPLGQPVEDHIAFAETLPPAPASEFAAPPAEPAPAAPPASEPAPAPEQAAASPAPVAAEPAAPAAQPTAPGKLSADAKPRLVVLRGLKISAEYPLYEGHNFIGRADEKPVDIDLEDQEPPDRIWSSRQHALITFEDDGLVIEDLNSSNGTFVNRSRIYPGQKRPLQPGDVIQIGTVQMKVKV